MPSIKKGIQPKMLNLLKEVTTKKLNLIKEVTAKNGQPYQRGYNLLNWFHQQKILHLTKWVATIKNAQPLE